MPDRSTSSRRGLAKGKDWERSVAEALSLWISRGAEKRILARQSMMGRMVECIYGDMAIAPKIPAAWLPAARWFMDTFMVDAKARKAFSMQRILGGASTSLWEWWDKLYADAHAAGAKHPIMCLIDGESRSRVVAVGSPYGNDASWVQRGLACEDLRAPRVVLHGDGRPTILLCEMTDFMSGVSLGALGCPGAANA